MGNEETEEIKLTIRKHNCLCGAECPNQRSEEIICGVNAISEFSEMELQLAAAALEVGLLRSLCAELVMALNADYADWLDRRPDKMFQDLEPNELIKKRLALITKAVDMGFK